MPSVRRATCVEKLSGQSSWRACGVLQRTRSTENFHDMSVPSESSVSCSTLWWLPTLPTSQQPQPLKSDEKSGARSQSVNQSISPCFCVFFICFVATCCMSIHASGALHLAHCIFVTVDPYDTSAWIQVFGNMHCHIAVNIGLFDVVETLRPRRFWIWMFFPAIFVAVDRTSQRNL